MKKHNLRLVNLATELETSLSTLDAVDCELVRLRIRRYELWLCGKSRMRMIRRVSR